MIANVLGTWLKILSNLNFVDAFIKRSALKIKVSHNSKAFLNIAKYHVL